jgi:hypothetical protein
MGRAGCRVAGQRAAGGDQTSAGRLADVFSRIAADASVNGPTVDVTRRAFHPPVIVERRDLGDGIQEDQQPAPSCFTVGSRSAA